MASVLYHAQLNFQQVDGVFFKQIFFFNIIMQLPIYIM